eukprot:1026557-Amphidinium_carterae.1
MHWQKKKLLPKRRTCAGGVQPQDGSSESSDPLRTVGERTCLLVLPQGHINESGPGLRAALEAASCQ